MGRYRVLSAVACSMLAVAAGAGCKAGSGSTKAATLYALATHVDSAIGTAAYQDAHTGDHPSPGDRIRTDGTGHAELDWPDGSLTRLGPATTLTVSPLARPDKNQVVVRLDVGQTWHRVERVTGSGGYQVDTPVGNATVRGTRFAITCTSEPACTYQVVDGTVAVTPTGGTTILLAAGQILTLKQGGTATPQTVGVPALNADPFIAQNQRLDALTVDQRGTALGSTATTSTTPAGTTGLSFDFDPKSGPSGTAIEARGKGCPPSDAHDTRGDLYFGLLTQTGEFVARTVGSAAPDGSFAATIASGDWSAAPGSYDVWVQCWSSGDEKTIPNGFAITGNLPRIG
jgi:uncharacterized cupin superfamily protein